MNKNKIKEQENEASVNLDADSSKTKSKENTQTKEIKKISIEDTPKKKRRLFLTSKKYSNNQKNHPDEILNLPNKMTLFRILMIPIIVLIMLFPYQQFNIIVPNFNVSFVNISVLNIVVFIIYVAVAFTDFIDGYIARKYNLVTSLGKFLDPIADKIFVNTLFIVFVFQSVVPVVPVLIMICRDLFVDGIRMVASEKNLVISAGFLGKVKTVLQMSTIALILINNLPFELWQIPASDFMLWLSALVSVASGYSYFVQAKDYILETK